MNRRTVAVIVLLLLVAAAITIVVNRFGGVCKHPVLALRLIAMESPLNLPVSVDGVRTVELRNSWNAPRSGGRKHQGIDIFGRRGAPIRSTTPGIVATVDTTKIGGKVVRVFGPDGEWHYYAHLESFGDLRSGDVINAGKVIGYVGDSGNAKGTPPHLHYGIYRFRGGAMNPYPKFLNRL